MRDAHRALAEILGDDAIKDAIEHYISGLPGSELARYVLWNIHPKVGMDYCYEIYRQDSNLERRRSAVELLRFAADERALPWVVEFLNDADPEIQVWGAGVVDQLLYEGMVTEADCVALINTIKNHENLQVRERYGFISGCLHGPEDVT